MSSNKLFTAAQSAALDTLANALADARNALAQVDIEFQAELKANEQAYDAEREMFYRLSIMSDSRRAIASSGVLCDLYEGLLKQAKLNRAFPQSEEAQ